MRIMNSSGNDSWHSSAGPPSHPGMDQLNQQPRPLGSFGYVIVLIAGFALYSASSECSGHVLM